MCGQYTICDILSEETDVTGLYVNCYRVEAFNYLSSQDPITLISGNTGVLPAKRIAANARNKQEMQPGLVVGGGRLMK